MRDAELHPQLIRHNTEWSLIGSKLRDLFLCHSRVDPLQKMYKYNLTVLPYQLRFGLCRLGLGCWVLEVLDVGCLGVRVRVRVLEVLGVSVRVLGVRVLGVSVRVLGVRGVRCLGVRVRVLQVLVLGVRVLGVSVRVRVLGVRVLGVSVRVRVLGVRGIGLGNRYFRLRQRHRKDIWV